MAIIKIQTDDGEDIASYCDEGGPNDAPIALEYGTPDHDFMEALGAARNRDGRDSTTGEKLPPPPVRKPQFFDAAPFENARTPFGWVEIQREDETKKFEDDVDACIAILNAWSKLHPSEEKPDISIYVPSLGVLFVGNGAWGQEGLLPDGRSLWDFIDSLSLVHASDDASYVYCLPQYVVDAFEFVSIDDHDEEEEERDARLSAEYAAYKASYAGRARLVEDRRCPNPRCNELCNDPDWLSCHVCGEALPAPL
jgi:hypothetical protein